VSGASAVGQMQRVEEETPVELATGKLGTDDNYGMVRSSFFLPHRIRHRIGDTFCTNNNVLKSVNSPPFQHETYDSCKNNKSFK